MSTIRSIQRSSNFAKRALGARTYATAEPVCTIILISQIGS